MRWYQRYQNFIWGFIGVLGGMALTIFIPSIQGKWDITSLAGVVLVILFALVSSDRMKEYSERLEKQHEQQSRELEIKFAQAVNEAQSELAQDARTIFTKQIDFLKEQSTNTLKTIEDLQKQDGEMRRNIDLVVGVTEQMKHILTDMQKGRIAETLRDTNKASMKD